MHLTRHACLPSQDVYNKLNITSANVVATATRLHAYYANKAAPAVPAVSPFFVPPGSHAQH